MTGPVELDWLQTQAQLKLKKIYSEPNPNKIVYGIIIMG